MRGVPGERRTTPRQVGDIDRRVGKLERHPSATGWEDVGTGAGPDEIGIQFGVQPQQGSWLDIRTDTAMPSGSDGIFLYDTAGVYPVSGITLESSGRIDNFVPYFTVNNALTIDNPPTDLGTPTDIISFATRLTSVNSLITFNIDGTGAKFRIVNGSTVLLEVRDDNTFHILSGAAWVADL